LKKKKQSGRNNSSKGIIVTLSRQKHSTHQLIKWVWMLTWMLSTAIQLFLLFTQIFSYLHYPWHSDAMIFDLDLGTLGRRMVGHFFA
jgi:hypothetical protein